jgi:DNA-binding MarR family transcriptional regulator
MTQTRTEARPPAAAGQAIGQAVGQAESALTRLLAGVLAETGTNREDYLALQRLTALGDAATRDRYVRDLGDWLNLDLWAAGELADGLAQAGLITAEDGTIRLSAAGAELRETIRGSLAAVTASLYGPLDPADVGTTVRTLQEITTRARALRSVPAPLGSTGGR